MTLQFSMARLLRGTAFFAVAWWMLIWLWRVFHGTGSHPHMAGWALLLAPAAMGGAIGALFGKTPHGVFCGFGFVFACVVMGMIWIAVAGLF